MGKQNGQRAQQKRERNAKKTAAKTKGASQLKSNEKAKTIQCQICKVLEELSLAQKRERRERERERFLRNDPNTSSFYTKKISKRSFVRQRLRSSNLMLRADTLSCPWSKPSQTLPNTNE
ncbi:Zf-met2 domain-containing protein [Balamuthia mandrillaris]